MTFTVSDDVREFCLRFDIVIERDVYFGGEEQADILIEAPADIRRGTFAIDLVGGFSNLGSSQPVHQSTLQHVNMIGRFCSIAGDVRIGTPEPATDMVPAPTLIGNDVSIGEGAFIGCGVSIGDGAIVAAHAVVTSDVPPYAIVGGVPAGVIGYRFAPEVVQELLDLQWWSYGRSALEGVDFTDMGAALRRIPG